MALRTAVVFVWHGQKKETWRERRNRRKRLGIITKQSSVHEKNSSEQHTLLLPFDRKIKRVVKKKNIFKKKEL